MSTDKTDSKPWSVNLHYEDPEKEDSDGCATGEDFATEEEARQCISDFLAGKRTVFTNDRLPGYYNDVPYIELDGPTCNEVVRRTKQIQRQAKEEESYQRMARSEVAMQAGMGMGVHAYNDAMGYDSEPYDPSIHDNELDRGREEHERDRRREEEDSDNETPWGETHSAF